MKINDYTSITFLYPSYKIGGAQLLFIRLAIELSKYNNILVNVVDYPGGYLESKLKNYKKIKIYSYESGYFKISDETVVITPLSNFADLKYMIRGDFRKIKILLWAIQPTNIDYVLNSNGRNWLGGKFRIKKFLKTLCCSGNILFMDEANFLAVKDVITINKSHEYLQIPVEIKDYNFDNKYQTDKINLAWLGSVTVNKIFPIIKIIDEIKSFEHSENFFFHIIGSGEYMSQLETYLKKSKINYVLAGTLEDEQLSHYLKKHIQIGVAMGTSCMEFALRKVPAFLIDFSEKRLPGNIKYNWLFETKNYNLGSHVNKSCDRNHNFSSILNQYKNDSTIGEKCFEYVRNNHDIKKVSIKLISHCNDLKPIDVFKFNQVQKLLNPPIYYCLYYLYRKIKKL